jgi:sulfonate transport system ATP-binding protein
MSAVAITGLRKAYHGTPVFDGLDLTVGHGETLAILGASGCGKSTVLRCIAGLTKPDGGSVAASGEVGYVFQEPRLFPWLTVWQNVAFAARDDAELARVDEVIALVGLEAATDRLPKALSGGMSQRAALARTLVRAPEIILLDEPLAALDALKRIELRAALAQIIAASGATAILVTHDIDEALELATRVVVLGGSPSHIVATQVRGGIPAVDRAALLAALGVVTTAQATSEPRRSLEGRTP